MILIRRHGAATWHAPTVTAYDNERAIQRILEQSPHLLPGSENVSIAMASEFGAPRAGFVDLVGVTTDGVIVLVECKLKTNPETRRSVVGQVLAYAADLWGMSYEEFDRAYEARAGASLTQRILEVAVDDFDEERFRANVAANLAAGRFRLIIAVDAITDELKRIVQFLNQHTNAELEVLALELGYVADEGVEILVPTAYGVEVQQAIGAARATGRRWDEASVFAALERACTPHGLAAARRLYEFAKAHGVGFNWGSAAYASVTARMPIGDRAVSVFSIYEYPVNNPVLAMNFEYIRPSVTRDALERLAEALRSIPTVDERLAGLEQADFNRRPTLPINSTLIQPGAVETIEAALGELRSNSAPN